MTALPCFCDGFLVLKMSFASGSKDSGKSKEIWDREPGAKYVYCFSVM